MANISEYKWLTFPLGTTTIWVNVSFNKAYVAFNDGADVLYPMCRGSLVFLD